MVIALTAPQNPEILCLVYTDVAGKVLNEWKLKEMRFPKLISGGASRGNCGYSKSCTHAHKFCWRAAIWKCEIKNSKTTHFGGSGKQWWVEKSTN